MSLEYGSAMAHISISRHAASMIVQLLPDFETIFGCLLVAALTVSPIKGVMQGSACASLCLIKLDPACSNYSLCASCMLLSQFLNLRSMLLSQLLKTESNLKYYSILIFCTILEDSEVAQRLHKECRKTLALKMPCRLTELLQS